MIDIPGCSERTNCKFYIFVVSCLKVICWALIIYVALSLHSIRHNYLHNYDVFSMYYIKIIILDEEMF